jgi:ftsJ-like methyltransferase
VNVKNKMRSLRDYDRDRNRDRDLKSHANMQTTRVGMPVSRAENKLAGAAQAFSYDFRGKIVLDIGSSTGGFTEYALLRGAKRVIAVEKGTKQMKAPLRFDPRIDLREKTDIFFVTRSSLSRDQDESNENESKNESKTDSNIDTILADVSFISLKQVLLHAKKQLASPQTDFLVMLKPQFEAKPFQLKNGIVKNETIRRDIIKDFELWLKNNGFLIINKRDNLLAGKNGNLERFYFLKIAEPSHRNKRY